MDAIVQESVEGREDLDNLYFKEITYLQWWKKINIKRKTSIREKFNTIYKMQYFQCDITLQLFQLIPNTNLTFNE